MFNDTFKCICVSLLKIVISCKIVTFHIFPIHNSERLKLWLLTLHLDINTPEHALIFKRVCSNHVFDDYFKPSQQGNRCFLKASAVPNTDCYPITDYATPGPISRESIRHGLKEQFEESLELDVSMLSIVSIDHKKDLSFQPLSSTSTSAPSTEDEECEMHWKQIKWIVNEPNVMELFKRCQECGSVITKTRKATVGSVLRVHWECEKNHKGKWSSCTDVRGIMLSIDPPSDKKDLSFLVRS
uniref:THAP-type domain-containing protein n=1 Tax=Sinocyclocheilus rhinocerous TaxID=307959 RepID=A0A673HX50_9TELE